LPRVARLKLFALLKDGSIEGNASVRQSLLHRTAVDFASK
jgi:hypothetical protein